MVGTARADGGEELAHDPSDAVFRKLVEGTTNHAQFMLDPAGEITEWFSGARTLYGYDPDVVIGESMTFLLADKDDPPEFTALLDEAKTEGTTREG